jgi:hypothetical protein
MDPDDVVKSDPSIEGKDYRVAGTRGLSVHLMESQTAKSEECTEMPESRAGPFQVANRPETEWPRHDDPSTARLRHGHVISYDEETIMWKTVWMLLIFLSFLATGSKGLCEDGVMECNAVYEVTLIPSGPSSKAMTVLNVEERGSSKTKRVILEGHPKPGSIMPHGKGLCWIEIDAEGKIGRITDRRP